MTFPRYGQWISTVVILCAVGAVPNQTAVAQSCSGGVLQEIDFSTAAGGVALSPGDIIGTGAGEYQFDDITVTLQGGALPLVIFDTENPTGNDWDLGSPNEAYGGPGRGSAGGPGGAGPNPVGLGHALIINEDWDTSDPDDFGGGGVIIFVFDEAVEVNEIHTIDADEGSLGEARVYSDVGGNNLIGSPFFGQDLGADNGFQIINVATPNARRMEFEFDGSGAITKLVLCGGVDATASIGDTVFHDDNNNGVIDGGEFGLAGVDVQLKNNVGSVIATQTTNALGQYNFTGLLAADYTVDVVESTLPASVSLTTANEPLSYSLSTGEDYNDADFGYQGDALPVELVTFEALVDGGDVLLDWKTASELNNAGFEVQWLAQVETSAWEVLGFVGGYGTTEQPQAYTYRAPDMTPGLHRFRLKQVDYDGTFEYSPEVEVVIDLTQRYVIEAVYPNPFNPQAQFRFAVKQAQWVEVGLYDVLGRQVQQLYLGQPAAGQMQEVQIDGGGLPSGTYLVRVIGEAFIETQRVVLSK